MDPGSKFGGGCEFICVLICSVKSPAVVAWSVKALAFHSVNSSPEQAVDQISI